MSEDPHAWETATRLIRGGTMRTAFNETSEAMFLTQSFVYDTAENAVARFNGDEPGYVYSRFANPTVQMFEERLALLEGAQACRAQTSGMAAVHAALMGLLRAGDHLVAGRTPVLFTSRGELRCRHAAERRQLGQALAGAMARVAALLAPELGYLISKGGITSHTLLAEIGRAHV